MLPNSHSKNDCVDREYLVQHIVTLQSLICDLLMKNERLRFQLLYLDNERFAVRTSAHDKHSSSYRA